MIGQRAEAMMLKSPSNNLPPNNFYETMEFL